MKVLLRTSKFKRAFKHYIGQHLKSLEIILAVLDKLAQNPFEPSLETHKLKGEFLGDWACSAGYDLRITFTFVESQTPKAEDDILLLNIGTHDEVY